MIPNTGDVYYSHRDDTYHEKNKFQLYLSNEHVLLINTKKSKHNLCPQISPTDCSLLSHDCYICMDNVFRYDPTFPVLKKEQINPLVLEKLKTFLLQSTTIPVIQTKLMIGIISEYLVHLQNIT